MQVVGAAGFEPATSCSQSSHAARLRYAPIGETDGTRSTARMAILTGGDHATPAPPQRRLTGPTSAITSARPTPSGSIAMLAAR